MAKGVLYGALGLLAVDVASGEASSERASSRGAIELVASQPMGQWLLAILTIGLFALAAWHVVQAITGDPVEGSEARDRAKFAGKAILYFATASTALTILLSRSGNGGTSSPRSGDSEAEATATVMNWPAGPWIVGIIGIVVIGVAVHEMYRNTWKKAFMRRLSRFGMRADLASGIERAGQVGYAARAIVAVIMGAFLVAAAAQHDPRQAVGLSGALGALTREAWGQGVLWIVAVGLLLYGCFCFAEAKFRRAA